jgi:tetratricopeptide (TPR) repeat protein
VIDEDFLHGRAFLDTYRLAHLTEPLYFIDGQIHDEVYVYGSFLQSKMHAAGVVCSDCHDPHSLEINDGSAACLRCHAASTFAQITHTNHGSEATSPDCVSCHMPARTYMGVDERHDHSFRVPRPDLSIDFGVPNACTGCHDNQSAQWAAQRVVEWFPDGQTAKETHYSRIIAAGRARRAGAAQELAKLIKDSAIPAIVRATAVETIGAIPDPAAVTAMRTATADPDPIVRHAAAEASENLPEQFRVPLLLPLLDDPVRAVRITAAHSLLGVSAQYLPEGAQSVIDKSLDEYADSERANLERAESRTNLGTLAARRGQTDQAQIQFTEAVAIDPFYVPAYVNWADLLRALGRDEEGERTLRQGIEKVPDDSSLHHALGLLLHRTGRSGAALDEFLIAADTDDAPPRYIYVYALALADAGHRDRALTFLKRAHEAAPHDTEILFALATTYRDRGNYEAAIEAAKKLAIEAPGAPAVRQLLEQLERRTPPPGAHPPVPGTAVQ